MPNEIVDFLYEVIYERAYILRLTRVLAEANDRPIGNARLFAASQVQRTGATAAMKLMVVGTWLIESPF